MRTSTRVPMSIMDRALRGHSDPGSEAVTVVGTTRAEIGARRERAARPGRSPASEAFATVIEVSRDITGGNPVGPTPPRGSKVCG